MSNFNGVPAPAWITLTAAGISGGTVRYVVLNGIVVVDVAVTLTASLTAGSNLTIVTAGNGIPAELRPTGARYAAAFTGNVIGYIAVNSDGSIQLHASTATMTTAGGTNTFAAGL